MQKYIACLITLFSTLATLHAAPPSTVPKELLPDYTMNGKIPIFPFYLDDSYPPEKPIVYTVEQVDALIIQANNREERYYRKMDTYLYAALDEFAPYISGKDVAIMGSVTPWYEAIIIARGGHPFSIDYNRIVSEDPRITTYTVAEYQENPRLFDTLVSVSSYEHDGLGRYGDPLDPYGDIKAMQIAKTMLKPGGILILAVPVGKDALCWNAHRVYGAIRLPMLLEGWEKLQSFGFTKKNFHTANFRGKHQPVFVLKPV
jgi:SAM-dependent methyltransferase